jgi:hypothetical protein
MEDINWLFELKEKVPQFLERLKGKKNKGFFHYSLSGDLYDENVKWGLGNTVFAVKIYYTLDMLKDLSREEKEAMANFIKSFQRKDGTIYDPLVKKKAFLRNILSAIKNLDFNNFFCKQTIIAETRQAISALELLEEKPSVSYQKFSKIEKEIEKYLNKLDWLKPWGAGSHFSHLIFFLKNSDLENKRDLIDFAINWVNKLQNSKDGSWYRRNSSLQQKINGAMKIIIALKVANRMNFQYPEKLIDLCLSVGNNRQACDNFNIICVLKYASKMTGNNYRFDEIKNFAQNRLEIYKKYYFPEIGGFSFLPNGANIYYYNAKLTKGLKEPDIHGTAMFLWGISIIAQILRIEDKLGFKEQIP